MKALVLASAAVLLVACGGTARSVVYPPVYDEPTGTLWLVEHDTPPKGGHEQVTVIVCHREAAPACVRVTPPDVRATQEYEEWLRTMPDSVRRLAALDRRPAPAPAPQPPVIVVQPSAQPPAPAAVAPVE